MLIYKEANHVYSESVPKISSISNSTDITAKEALRDLELQETMKSLQSES